MKAELSIKLLNGKSRTISVEVNGNKIDLSGANLSGARGVVK